jgi:hypothetical protein
MTYPSVFILVIITYSSMALFTQFWCGIIAQSSLKQLKGVPTLLPPIVTLCRNLHVVGSCLVSPPFFWKKQHKVKSRCLIATIIVTNTFLHICVLHWEEEAEDMCVLASKGICNIYLFRMVIVISSALIRTKSWRFFYYDSILLVFLLIMVVVVVSHILCTNWNGLGKLKIVLLAWGLKYHIYRDYFLYICCSLLFELSL